MNNDGFKRNLLNSNKYFDQDDINKVEPLYYPRDIADITNEELLDLEAIVPKINKRLAFQKGILLREINNISLSKKYLNMLRFFKNDKIFIGENEQITINKENYKALLILLVSDPNCEYYNYYKELKNNGYDNIMIKKEFMKRFSFYSYKLLDLENQYVSLLYKYEEKTNEKTR